jgi:drug/metabolite transporter (DMT)-like permease
MSVTVITAPRNNLLGAACAMAGATLFSINDMAIKFLSGDYALHQIVFLRAIVGLALTLAIALPLAGGLAVLRTRRPGMHALRAACVIAVNTLFFLALAAMPIADATALFFVSPLAIAALSFAVLGERVGPWRWAAVGIGLLGVIVMLRPGSGTMQAAALLPLGAALAYAAMNLITRSIGGTERAVTMAVYTQLGFLVAGALMGLATGHGRFAAQEDPSLAFLLRGWGWPAPTDLPIFLMIGAASAGGAFLLSQAYRVAEAGLAAPFEYIALPLAVVWGVTIFGDLPDAAALAGMALIAGGGLLLIWRETRAARAARSLPPGAETR